MVLQGDAVAPSGRSVLGTAPSHLSVAIFEAGTSLVLEY
jgi:hypothetical protein